MIIKKNFGGYEMTLNFKNSNEYAQVTMNDLSARLPMVWSKTMNSKEAHSAMAIFESIGFYNVF